ncbi:MAG: TonB-dependent receptor family protein, partial [bacterium]|nr:TonB-dependent receptor family protein [Candidatus Aphodosoma intestinipullorum]
LSYSLPAGNELQVNYTRRINRPRGWQINAFRDVSDSTNISFGNPYLDPEYADAAEFNYIKTWEEHALSASLYYRHMSNMVRRVSYLGADDVMYSTFENISDGHSAGLEIVAKNKVTKWLNLTTTLNGYYSYLGDVYYDTNLDGTEDLLSPAQNTFSFSARIMANFIMPLGFSGQLTGFYHSPDVVAQGRTKAHYAVDLGLRKSFLKKSLNLNLTIRDIFNTRRWRQTTWGDNFWQYSEFASRGTYFQLSASYSFGNLSFDKRRTHESVGGEGGPDVGF